MICGRSLESREVLEGSFVSNLLDGQLLLFFVKVIRSDKSLVFFYTSFGGEAGHSGKGTFWARIPNIFHRNEMQQMRVLIKPGGQWTVDPTKQNDSREEVKVCFTCTFAIALALFLSDL